MSVSEDELCEALSAVLLSPSSDFDEDLVPYLAGMVHSAEHSTSDLAQAGMDSPVGELLGPFLESSGCEEDVISQAVQAVNDLASKKIGIGAAGNGGDCSANNNNETDNGGARRLRQGLVSMSSTLDNISEHEADANRFLWGTDSGVAAFTNEQRDAHTNKSSAKDRRKAKQELEKARKEYEAKIKAMEDAEEKDSGNAVTNMVLPDYGSGRNEKDIQVRNVGLALDTGRTLLDNGEIKFTHGHRYGLVGKNGVGKTTLLKAIASLEIEGFPRHHRILHVRQEIKAAGGDISVLDAVMEADVERNALLAEEKELLQRLEEVDNKEKEEEEAENRNVDDDAVSVIKKREILQAKIKDAASDSFAADLKRLDEVYARLSTLSADSAESRAATILSGLQFTPEMQSGPTSALSGGWRMRVSLAAALFIEPDLLMLDEPTNHLDLEAVLWLESYLVKYKHTLVVVSHDRSFLNAVCTDTIEFSNLKLTYYKGDYDTYVRTAEENTRNAMRVYQAYQDKRAHMMDFITKFRANAKRASIVQSRIKAVEKMDLEAPDPVEVEAVWTFSIPNPEPLGRPIIAVDDVTFDYAPTRDDGTKKPVSQYLLQDANFGVDLESRIGILGANGAGKSTLLNLIMDKLTPCRGSVSRNGNLRLGYFTQHSADTFDLHLSAVENMLAKFEKAEDQEMRSFLGKFQIQGTDAIKPMMMLSGGQKSRIAFAALAYQKPHVIVFDEPTNHLDMESIDALVGAVKDYRGGLIVVSHDEHFMSNCCSELWVVGEGHVTKFKGGFDDYKKETLEKTSKRIE
eukprot:CAMPEP_0178505484 /NCGR_PEP_ID=MMETSP0696-20121128/19156_1 /TAXON_ID=265572 /ORGANISM="Extubocellulus spinifer, Strain CCMP396" /LENGTH=799 /DNA_ID=CAMNT_0020134799 /DNA_START=104 /DNA_END=2500 /DNA_ORIENTATION=-